MYGSVLIRGTRFISHHTKILSHSCEIPESLYETISWPPYWDVVSSAVVSPLPTCEYGNKPDTNKPDEAQSISKSRAETHRLPVSSDRRNINYYYYFNFTIE